MSYRCPFIDHNRRRGSVVIVVALCMIPLLGFAALVLDAAVLMDQRRQAQKTADAAALAGATDLFVNWNSYAGLDTPGTAASSAQTTATANGFANNVNGNQVIVTVPGNTPVQSSPLVVNGSGKLKPGYVEVVIHAPETRFFSKIWSSAGLMVSARAVARGTYNPAEPGILVLDPTGSNDLTATNTGNVTVIGGAIIVDSTDPNGATISNTASITASNFRFSGNPGYNPGNQGHFYGPNNSAPSIVSSAPYTPDPLAQLTEAAQPVAPPTPTATTNGVSDPSIISSAYNNPSQGIQWSNGGAGQVLNLYPGYYPGINITGGGTVILNDNSGSPGIYYIGSQGFSITNTANISGSDIMIYSNGQGSISLTSTGSATLSPPTSGTYLNMMIFQERSSNKQISITGGQNGNPNAGDMNITGTFYAAAAKLSITAQGNLTSAGSQYISWQLAVTASGNFTVNANGNATPTRLVGLVE